MSVSYEITGGLVHLSGNPIQITLTASVALLNHKLAVKVKCDQLLFAEQVEEIEPKDLVSVFNLQGMLDEPLPIDFTFPAVGVVSAHPALMLVVELEIGEVWDDANGDRQYYFQNVAEKLRILDGKLLQGELGSLNQAGKSFASEYITGGKFLTFLPDNQKVSPDQILKLWFLSPGTETIAAHWHCSVELHGEVEHLDLNDAVGLYGIESTDLASTGLAEFNINPIFMGMPSLQVLSAGYIKSFTFWLTNDGAGNADLSERRTFIVDNAYYETQVFGFYRNRLSAIDPVWFHGSAKENLKVENENSYRPAPVGAGTKVASLVTITASGQRSWTFNTGVKSLPERRATRSFLEAKERWIIDPDPSAGSGAGSVLVPVYVDSGDFEIDDSMLDVQSIEITLYEANKN